jgi:hypothetical protein
MQDAPSTEGTVVTDEPLSAAVTPPATKPSGPVAAAFIAAGIGSTVLGIAIVLSELDGSSPKLLDWAARFGLGSGVGPLSGKVLLATIAFFASWGILHVMWRDREFPFDRILLWSLVLVGIGFLLTFPPIFEGIAHLFGA